MATSSRNVTTEMLVVGWFTWALSVVAAASDKWFIGSVLKAGKADVLEYCSDVRESGPPVAVRWCALCEYGTEKRKETHPST